MEEIPIPVYDEARQIGQIFAGKFDAPAFMRRGRDVEGSWKTLVEECRRKREPLLEMVKLRLGTLHGLIGGDWSLITPYLVNEADLLAMSRLHEELRPQLRLPVAPTTSPKAIRTAFLELVESLERFNRLWRRALAEVDFDPINKIRDGYNRYYLLEKECAVGAARLSRQEFRRLELVTPEMMLKEFPTLPVPVPKTG